MSGLFNLLTYPLSLPINPFWSLIIMGIVAVLAFAITFKIVGFLKYEGGISNSGILSLFHWVIRLLIYFGIWAVLCGIIKVIQWIIELLGNIFA